MINIGKAVPLAIALAGWSAAASPLYAQISIYSETEDAGETLGTAQDASDFAMLQSISGMLSGFDDPADLFKISLVGGQPFFASTVGGADFDTQLFLFDSEGFGVYSNNDAGGTLQSTLPADSPFTPSESGTYYLGISGFDYSPVNADGENIFPSLFDFPIDVPAEDILSGVYGPSGPGGDAPLEGFDGAILTGGGSYTISLSQPSAAVPEPTSLLALLAVGAAGTLLGLKHQKSAYANRP